MPEAGFLSSLTQWVEEYGVLGVFLISLVSNAIPYSTIPYVIGIVAYASRLSTRLEVAMVILAGALGAALGKAIVYMMGRAAHLKASEETKRNLEVFVNLFRKSALLAIFLFAALPLPDDVIYVPLGVAGYNFRYFFIGVFLGKIVITGFAILAGKTLSMLFQLESQVHPVLLTTVIIALIVIVSLAIVETDWLEIANKSSKSWLEGFKEFWFQVYLLLTLRSPRGYYKEKRARLSLQQDSRPQ